MSFQTSSPLSRRQLLALTGRLGAGIATAAMAPGDLLAQVPAGKDARLLIRSPNPLDLETPTALLDAFITPVAAFYVRSHMMAPRAEEGAWRLVIDGEVATPQSLSLSDLRGMPALTVTATLECAGNGRAFFDPPVAGIQWRRGAVGTARWTGVRLVDLLKRAGALPSGTHVWMAGGDRPFGTQPSFVRQLPIAKAADPDTLVAYAMNDVPLPSDHGFPLRVIAPGWEGAYSVKWLDRLTVAPRDHDGFWVASAYRYPATRVAPGAAVDAKQMEPLTGLAVKSLITRPLEGAVVAPGRVAVAGFAWAGETDVAKVDVSTDGGASWQPARLIGDRVPYTWRRFEFAFDVTRPESYTILSRATDGRGHTQPVVPPWNPSGYLWNAPDQVRIDVRA